MSILPEDKTALMLIDLQKAFEDLAYWGGERNNPDAEINASLLLRFWRKHSLPLFHIKHCSANPASPLAEGAPGNEFMDIVTPMKGEPIIRKNVNSAFIGTDLRQLLDAEGIRKVVIAGLTTDHCVSTTVRMAANYGFETFVVDDATATFCKTGFDGSVYSAELIHKTALASLNGEFAAVILTKDLIF
jgi:nicotinamidase-related amidase